MDVGGRWTNPEVVVHAGLYATVGRVAELDDIRWTGSGGYGGAESKDKASAHEGIEVVCGDLHGCPDQDDEATDEDADATTVAVGEDSQEGEGSDLSEVVDDEDYAGGRAGAGEVEGFLVGGHGIDRPLCDVSESCRREQKTYH